MSVNVLWTPFNLGELKRLVDEGASYKAIGENFGKSRGAVASAIRRYYHGMRSNSKVKPPTTVEEQEKEEVARRVAPLLRGPFRVKRYIAPQESYIKYPDPRFLSDGFCRAIIGEPKDLTCCGRPVRPQRIYCEEHNKNYKEKPKDERTLERFAAVFK